MLIIIAAARLGLAVDPHSATAGDELFSHFGKQPFTLYPRTLHEHDSRNQAFGSATLDRPIMYPLQHNVNGPANFFST